MRAIDLCRIAGTALVLLAFATPAAAEMSRETRAFGATEPARTAPIPANPDLGKRLYEERCTQCHGTEGKGDGPAADFVYPRPRDFTLALFKVRSTPSGQVPTDHDLFRAISEGLPGTSMPAWKKHLSEEERWQLVHHVKTFDTIGVFKDDPATEQVAIGTPPAVTDELVKHGEVLYQDKKCWQCHGRLGRGDGVSAKGLKDDWGQPIRPVNFSKSWRFRAGDRIEDIYRTFTTGFNGTPMPAFVDSIPKAEDRWALAAYVKSLSRPMRTGQVLKAGRVDGPIPTSPDDPAWERAELLDVPLAGQIILEPRWFKPAHDVVTARAMYNDDELAVLLEWDDGTGNTGTDGKPADQVALQWPLEDAARLAGEKPYFILGERRHGIDHWRWRAGSGLERVRAFGHDRAETVPAGTVRAEGRYKDGQYRVILRRPLAAADDHEAAWAAGQFIPVAFHLWDGEHGEEGLKGAISSWYYVLLEPNTPFTVYLWPGMLGLVVLGGELVLVRRLRRRRQA